MSEIGQVLAFAAQLNGEKARIAYSGYVRRDPMARLHLRDGRAAAGSASSRRTAPSCRSCT